MHLYKIKYTLLSPGLPHIIPCCLRLPFPSTPQDIKVSNTAHKGLREQLLESTSLAFPFLFLIASQHGSIVYDTPGPYLQLISTLCVLHMLVVVIQIFGWARVRVGEDWFVTWACVPVFLCVRVR